MKKIYFATQNRGKFSHLSKALSKYGIHVIRADLNLPEPSDELLKQDKRVIERLLEMEHKPEQLCEIARNKVLTAYRQIKKPCVALDAGFYIDSLNGFPGAYVNVVLKHPEGGIEIILDLVKGKPRDCQFINVLAYTDEELYPEPKYFLSVSKGSLSETARGKIKEDMAWSKLNLIFIPEEINSKTLAEMTYEEYNEYRKQRENVSFTTKFGEWYSKK